MTLNKELALHFDTHNIRVIIDEKNQPWFVAKDVAEVLGYRNTRDAISKHCKNQNTVAIHDGTSGNPNVTIIPEADVYRLIFRSKLPAAERFERWVTEEVLPQIRKTGSYGVEKSLEEILKDPRQMASYLIQLADERDKRIELESRLEEVSHEIEVKDRLLIEVRPKVIYHDEVLSSEGTITSTDIAKSMGITAIKLHRLLQKRNVIFRQGKRWVLYHTYQDKGIAKIVTLSVTKKEGNPKEIVTHLRWTAKGQKFIHELLNPLPHLNIGQNAINNLLPPPDFKLPS
jgi:anti-repressor protein